MNRKPPMAYVFVGERDLLVGHARLCPLNLEGRDCWVESVVVRKTMQGRGIGRALMEGIEDEAR